MDSLHTVWVCIHTCNGPRMQLIPNSVSETKPAGYDFGYMHVRQSHILWTLYIGVCIYICNGARMQLILNLANETKPAGYDFGCMHVRL